MKVCDKCKKGEVEYEIDGWLSQEDNIWEYSLCKSCYNKIKKFIDNLKNAKT